MRVIKENKTEIKHKCSYCKSIFAYRNTEKTFMGYLKCPVCENLDKPSIFDRKVKK